MTAFLGGASAKFPTGPRDPDQATFRAMDKGQFQEISQLQGLDFIKALLLLEERRFEQSKFFKRSTFEDINLDFGIFPSARSYPVYFAGDICEPDGKIIFLGINPGFDKKSDQGEQDFLRSHGSFEGYRRIFSDFFGRNGGGLIRYFANIAGFLRRYKNITEDIDWGWLQKNLISLELIPYHSANNNGLRINDLQKYRDIYFETILKILQYLSPKEPVLINGFPTFRTLIAKNNQVAPEFRDVIKFSIASNVAVGTIAHEFSFIGLPFLNRPRGGVDSIVAAINKAQGSQVPDTTDAGLTAGR